MIKKQDKNAARKVRHARVRRNVQGTPERPRLNVYRSSNHIYVQVVDDLTGTTLLSASTLSPELADIRSSGGNVEAAKQVGELIAKKALGQGIRQVVFDRGGYLYHGRIAALADAARAAGLEF
mgnify:FL=1